MAFQKVDDDAAHEGDQPHVNKKVTREGGVAPGLVDHLFDQGEFLLNGGV